MFLSEEVFVLSEVFMWDVWVGYSNGKSQKVELVADHEDVTTGFLCLRERGLSDYRDELLYGSISQRLSRIIPMRGFSPVHCVMTKNPTLIYKSFLGENRLDVPVMWRIAQPGYVNLWHFVHEVTEINLKFNYEEKPRWIVEGIAQLAAYIFFKEFHRNVLPVAVNYYSRWGEASMKEVLGWRHKHVPVDNIKDMTKPFKALLDWANQEHDKELEHKLYATVLKLFTEQYGTNEDLFDIFTLLDTPTGVEKITNAIFYKKNAARL